MDGPVVHGDTQHATRTAVWLLGNKTIAKTEGSFRSGVTVKFVSDPCVF